MLLNDLRRKQLRVFLRNRIAVVGFFLTLLLIMIAFFAGYIAPYDPDEQNVYSRLTSPDLKHWFGTDSYGRDTLSRVIHGSRVSLTVGVLSIMTEIVFSRPGLGKLMVLAMKQRDYQVLQSVMVIYSTLAIFINLFVDLVYGLIDPRIKYG